MKRIIKFVQFHLKRASKSAMVGAEGALVQMVITYVLTDILGFWYLFSTALGILVAFTHNYFLNYYWAFKDVIKDKPQVD